MEDTLKLLNFLLPKDVIILSIIQLQFYKLLEKGMLSFDILSSNSHYRLLCLYVNVYPFPTHHAKYHTALCNFSRFLQLTHSMFLRLPHKTRPAQMGRKLFRISEIIIVITCIIVSNLSSSDNNYSV